MTGWAMAHVDETTAEVPASAGRKGARPNSTACASACAAWARLCEIAGEIAV
jgi:hypothetical protein